MDNGSAKMLDEPTRKISPNLKLEIHAGGISDAFVWFLVRRDLFLS
jgi:hypothetical protein